MQQLHQQDKRVTAMQEKIQAMMKEPPPRLVPKDVNKCVKSPIASFFVFMGGFFAVFIICMYIFSIYRPSIDRGTASPEMKAAGMAIMLMCTCVMLFSGIRTKMVTQSILKNGQMLRGKVLKVVPMSARINQNTFSKVRVQITTRDGTEILGKDEVNNRAVEYFLKARDEDQEVDVIYHPNAANRVILPMRVAMAHRFD